jgi:hypothetical protein
MTKRKWKEDFAGLLLSHAHANRGYFSSLRIAEKFNGVTAVRFSDLLREDKMGLAHEGQVLVLDGKYFDHIARSSNSYSDFCVLAALYFFHEAHHFFSQGLGAKHNVGQLKKTGPFAQATLLNLDLEADVYAVLLTQELLPRRTRLEITDIQSRSLLDFPTTSEHSEISGFRKSTRLIARRIDFLMRRLKLCSSLFNEYTYLFPTFGGGLFHLQSHNPVRLLGFSTLSLREQRFLETISDENSEPQKRLGTLDGQLTRILTTMYFVPQ